MDIFSYINDIVTNQTILAYIAIIALILTVLGLIIGFLGYIYGKRSYKTKKIYYSINSFNLIEDSINKFESLKSLKVVFDNKIINNVTVTNVLFINGGNDIIEPTDFLKDELLKIHIKSGGEILSVEAIHENDKSTKLIPKFESNSDMLLDFKYLNKKDIMAIKFLHTGKSDEDVEILGTLKGFGAPKKKSYIPPDAITGLFFGFSIGLLLSTLSILLYQGIKLNEGFKLTSLLLVILELAAILLIGYFTLRIYIKYVLPPGYYLLSKKILFRIIGLLIIFYFFYFIIFQRNIAFIILERSKALRTIIRCQFINVAKTQLICFLYNKLNRSLLLRQILDVN